MSEANRRSLRERLAWRWNEIGLSSAASAGRSELDKRGMNAVIFDSPREGVTVAIARGERAEQLREAWVSLFGVESSDGTSRGPAASRKRASR